jgi:hypothetical protein
MLEKDVWVVWALDALFRQLNAPRYAFKRGTYLGDLPQLEGQATFPTATVNAMIRVRTFWEKATLIHVEITRNDRAAPAERYARHWYDLHALSQRLNLVDQAMTDRETLRLVLRVNQAHYGGKGVRYEDCGTG